MRTRAIVGAAAATLLAASLIGCSDRGSDGASGDTSGTGEKQLVEATLRTDFKFNGYVAPLALALERGYYEGVGLDLSIEQGQGSSTTIQTVAAGRDDFGLADSTTAVKAISEQDVPIKMLNVYLQEVPTGLISHGDSDFDGSVEKLRGRTIFIAPGNAELIYLDAVLAANDMTRDDVDLKIIDSAAKLGTWLQTPESLNTGFSSAVYLQVLQEEPDAKYFSFGDYGLISYGTGSFTSDKMIKEHPEQVAGFVEATRKGWEDAVEDPEAAVDAAMKLFPDLDRDLMLGGLQVVTDTLLHTDATQNLPLGVTVDEDWTQMLQLLQDFADFKGSTTPADYYDSEFD